MEGIRAIKSLHRTGANPVLTTKIIKIKVASSEEGSYL
jgi:hypothetical protein